jgi:hypothetical protein
MSGASSDVLRSSAQFLTSRGRSESGTGIEGQDSVLAWNREMKLSSAARASRRDAHRASVSATGGGLGGAAGGGSAWLCATQNLRPRTLKQVRQIGSGQLGCWQAPPRGRFAEISRPQRQHCCFPPGRPAAMK